MPTATTETAPESSTPRRDRGITVYIPQVELKPLDEAVAAKRINRSYGIREAVKLWLKTEGKGKS